MTLSVVTQFLKNGAEMLNPVLHVLESATLGTMVKTLLPGGKGPRSKVNPELSPGKARHNN